MMKITGRWLPRLVGIVMLQFDMQAKGEDRSALRSSVSPEAATILLISLALIPGCQWYAELHITERQYKTYDDVVADGGIRYEWIPDWLPKSAKDIVVGGEIDTNEMWLRFSYDAGFSYDPGESQSVTDKCAAISAQEIEFPRTVIKARIPWWSVQLENRMNADAVFYACTRKIWDSSESIGTLVMMAGDGYYWERGD